ncbi:AAA family ATPase, partial [Omnitrophica bacterium]|nr:AAA family ATPase [Candidatus Omnitrophota bacterium]
MKLKKIELFGFKSFADRTEVIFDAGVTCVVGPNGCGKSNISDAMRWVLGERSAKLLRGSKMEDVIFNGTDFRKPLAMAEATLTIDNADRGLPIDYKEVSITRRLYRNGDSEYMINRTVCRLKDIQDLILDTGIGSNSYSMIEQGRIDYILSADPDERRFLIEEAAGISKYKVKKEEAIRKLERTEDNRMRLNDIIQEVKRNIQYAERQARRAERYQEQLNTLKDLELRKAFHDISIIEGEKQRVQANLTALEGEITQIDAQVQAFRKNQIGISETLHGILDRYASEDAKRHGLQSTIEQIEQQLQFHQEKRMEMATRGGEIQQELRQLTERMNASETDMRIKQEQIGQSAEQKRQAAEHLET